MSLDRSQQASAANFQLWKICSSFQLLLLCLFTLPQFSHPPFARCVETPRFATAAMSFRISSLLFIGAHAEEHLAWQINYSPTLSTSAPHVERLGALPKQKKLENLTENILMVLIFTCVISPQLQRKVEEKKKWTWRLLAREAALK